MLVLGIETTGEQAGAALADEKGVLAEISFRHRMELSRFLAPRIQDLLRVARAEIGDLEGIAVSEGPGSFTRVRIGVATAKALAYARGLPAAAVPTLAALAQEHAAPAGALVCAVAPASATHLFAALFQWREGALEPRAEAMLMAAADLAAKLSLAPLDVVLVGDPGAHGARLRETLGHRLTAAPVATPRPGTIARLGRLQLTAGQGVPAHALAPKYLRVSTPEARRQGAACAS